MSSASHFDWDDLLLQIEDRRVIPIVGPDLLVTRINGRETPLYRYLAGELANRLGIKETELPPEPGLNDVAMRYARDRRQSQRIYSRLRGLMNEIEPELPAPLEQLASIRHFNMFISTTFDPLLASAINKIRFDGEERVQSLAFSPHLKIQDLPCEVRDLERPVVYHLFGPLSSAANYVVSDEDALEFIHALQSSSRRPKLLFDELKNNNLLILGCGHADWLARFFLRTVRNEKLSIPGMSQTIIDDRILQDSRLVAFLEECAEAYVGGDSIEFVDELRTRWTQRHGTDSSTADEPVERGRSVPDEAIFLSFAHEDRTAVEKLRKGLESVGLDVWFAQHELQSGDDWDHEIRRRIGSCSLFLPIISRHSVSRREGYFRKEWHWAIKRAEGIDHRFPFIHPIHIDDTPHGAGGIPPFFSTRQWQSVSGDPPREFLERLKEIFRDWRVAKAGLA